MSATYDQAFIDWVKSRPMSARAKKAVEFILEHGSVTTDDIQAMGQGHAPRAMADLRDAGIKTAVTMVRINGKRRAQYTLVPDTSGEAQSDRKAIPKRFRDDLFKAHDYRCAVCNGTFTSRELQADHRVPFRIAGDADEFEIADFMPLCPGDNRGKSWSCEHCENWTKRDEAMCRTCFWCHPDGEYRHIAGQPIRRVDLSWTGTAEVQNYDRMAKAARRENMSPSEYVKWLVEESFGG
jgi:hypothetical protein